MSDQILLQQLNELNQALQQAQLWTQENPSANQLASVEPFSVDVMSFEQWLQWVFIPKLKILASKMSICTLPHKSDIATMAEHVFSSYSQKTENIMLYLKQIDNHLNQH